MVTEDSIIFDRKSVIPLVPRTKIFLTLTISTILIAGGTAGLMRYISPVLAVIPFALFIISKKYFIALRYLLLYIGLYCIELFVVPLLSGVTQFLVIGIVAVFSHMLPGFIMGYFLITSTAVSEFVCAMERMKISQKIVIPFSVVFRFLPTIKEEYSSIRDAMKMRNVLTIKKPLQVIEYTIIPLMMSVVKIGEELSASALTRGLGGTAKRTNICSIGFGVWDFILIAISIFSWCVFLFF